MYTPAIAFASSALIPSEESTPAKFESIRWTYSTSHSAAGSRVRMRSHAATINAKAQAARIHRIHRIDIAFAGRFPLPFLGT
jgi:hypothetical protein